MNSLLTDVYFAANALVLGVSILLTLNQKIETGVLGALGLSMIGVASAINLLKPMWLICAVDGPETLMVIGMAVIGVRIVSRRANTWRKEHKHG
ncbi:holin [Burkholderia cenocepacia]|uniref:holin n=1 Tax=Burkholderia cenocepacia TaxID=95486 RepID=UPI002AB5F0A8|nr:holin [Burkholderia cenocepacia]